MASLSPYLHLDGTTREAMNFYKEVLGGELELKTVGESGMPEDMPMPENMPSMAEMKDKIMHASLKADGITLMASDMMDPTSFTKGDNFTLCLVAKNKEEAETLFAKLSDGGKVTSDLKEEFFGLFGTLTDKFGVDWMVQADTKKE